MKQTSLLDSFLKKNKGQQKEDMKGQTGTKTVEQQNYQRQGSKAKFTFDSDDEDNVQKICTKLQKTVIGNSIKKQKAEPKNKKEKPNSFSDAEQKPNSQFTDSTPEWALPEKCLDAEKRPRSHPQYDPTTLYVPEKALSKLTALMRQYWNIKKQNFDKIILFKLGKFYEMFYEDAVVGNKYLDLKYMGTKMHTGFPQKSLERYSNQLVRLGFKTVVVEQMETPDQMNQRIQKHKAKGGKTEKTIARQITQVLTKGTSNPIENESSYLPNYLLSFQNHGSFFAFSLLQVTSNQILMGISDTFDKFKTVLYQTRPVQVIYDPDQIPFDIVNILSQSFLSMQVSKIKNKENLWHPLNAISEIEQLEKAEKMKMPKIFTLINQTVETRPKQLLYGTLSGLFYYLKKVLKFDYVMNAVRFTFFEKEKALRSMILDSQALQHLQIFQTTDGQIGSLFKTIDRTKTKFGKRLLRRWTASPLFNTYHINQRLNAVEDLQRFILERKAVSNVLSKLPDLEKRINQLYHYAVKTTSASKAIYFEDLSKARLKQFRGLFEHIESAWNGIRSLSKHASSFTSFRLKQLVTLNQSSIKDEEDVYYEDEQDQSNFSGLLPNIMSHLEQFNSYIKWEDDKPIPQKGLVACFDQLKDQIAEVENQLQGFLETIRAQMKEPKLKFVHTKQRYEIQIPEKIEKRRPGSFVFSSKKAGFSRYIAPEVRKLVKQLEKIEESAKQQMGLFVGFFFEEFKKKQKYWQRFVQILAEIDCLISFSEYSFMNDKVRPSFDSDKFVIQNGKHPCLLSLNFIPNTVDMSDNKLILLTGPNMGGKSTLLRMVCLLSVLAQMGCYVTAQKYECALVDRIFTRIGASDRLQLGKSTFFTEMQQTRNVLVNATPKSLAIIDELGRGTSTFDGMSIAYSVLKALVDKICCYSLFATHYHSLVQQFERNRRISLKMMNSVIRNDRIIFLYELIDGHVQKSFGLNVAKSVGISNSIIRIAELKASQMHQEIQEKRSKVYSKVMQLID